MPLSLKFAFRQLLKTPGFTVTALATLAICLAANLTIFAVGSRTSSAVPFVPVGGNLGYTMVTLFTDGQYYIMDDASAG